jgi:hypothetical protein
VPGVIDGRRWLRQRVQHLEAQLQAEQSEAQRAQLQIELDRARAELGRTRRRRWLFWGARPL